MSSRTLTFTLLIAALLMAGCDSSGGSSEVSVCQQDGVLIPLETGYTWAYGTSTEPAFTFDFRKKVTHETKTWTILEDHPAGDTFVAYRNDDNGTYYTAEYDFSDGFIEDDLNPANVFFRFPTEGGSNYTFEGIEVSVAARTVEAPAGTFEVCSYMLEGDGKGERTFSFAPGIGIVRYEQEEGAFELVSYNFQ